MLAVLSAVGLVLWIGAPIGLVAYGSLLLQDRELVEKAPVWLPPEQSSGTQQRPIGLQLSWERPHEVVAPAWTGVVQAVKVTAGDVVSSGQSIVLVDGIERLAINSEIPFSRELNRESSGVDVKTLNRVLSGLALASTPGSTDFTSQTLRGVRQLAGRLGVPNANDVQAFDPAWFIYLPQPAVPIATVSLRTGTPVPAAGTALLTAKRTLVGATLIDASSIPNSASQASSAESETNNEAVGQLPPTPGEADETLWLSTTELALTQDRQGIDGSALATLESLVQEGSSFTRASLHRAIGEDELRLPASSIVSDSDGRVCVVRQIEVQGQDATPRREAVPTEVVVVGSEAGSVWVTGELSVADRVLLNPDSSLRSCLP